MVPDRSHPAVVALRAGHKVRAKTWWWGRYIFVQKGHPLVSGLRDESGKRYFINDIPVDNWEIYEEEKHGETNKAAP